jgi:hypothetical protein
MPEDEQADIERIAKELIEQSGADAPLIARQHADAEGRNGNLQSAVKWRFVADAIERMQAPIEPPDTKRR